MIFRLIIAAAVLYLLYRFVKYVQNKPNKDRRSYYITLLIGLAAAGLVLMSVTGRVHWIAGLVGGALPFVRQFLLNHVYNKISQSSQNNTGKQQSGAEPSHRGNMTEAEALKILGLQPDASEDDIVRAHRQLIQKLHPDRGGNDYLASQLNDAKACLLKRYS